MVTLVCWWLQDNEELGLVQARWSFVNKDENLLTRLQNINLCFHFEVEQQVNGAFINFFGFNGTAGVWRIKALEDAGGWLERTTVEDMDIAVRAHLKGWKFVFLNDVEIGFWKKSNLILLFFLLRKLIVPFYSFTLFCIVLPLTMFVPEAELPAWVVCYVPATMSFLNILPAARSFPFIVPYLLFENTMSVTKFNAMISGLFQLGSAYEWVVTKKSGRSSDGDLISLGKKELRQQQQHASVPNLEAIANGRSQPEKETKRKHNRIYRKELALAFLLLTASARSLLSAQGIHFYFLLFQGISFLLVGLDLIGEQVTRFAISRAQSGAGRDGRRSRSRLGSTDAGVVEGFYSGCCRLFVPDDLTAFMTHHTTAPLTMPAILVVRRALAGGECQPYLCQVDCTATGIVRTTSCVGFGHVDGPTVHGCDDLAARSAYVISFFPPQVDLLEAPDGGVEDEVLRLTVD
ncbi:hypothetical protein B296_00045731 [Ensete ventricosum]|uniref:Glycosyltransferase 2-like domain-containing protein n=1 Tax=Ensete ventricosum TaxID=4639 RepID=A0A426Y8G1_ENSVE|nr:hypothetical protein B296_00045731 [Ensete ventricosum]